MRSHSRISSNVPGRLLSTSATSASVFAMRSSEATATIFHASVPARGLITPNAQRGFTRYTSPVRDTREPISKTSMGLPERSWNGKTRQGLGVIGGVRKKKKQAQSLLPDVSCAMKLKGYVVSITVPLMRLCYNRNANAEGGLMTTFTLP